MSVFSVSGILYSPPKPAVQITPHLSLLFKSNSFFRLALFFLETTAEQKKAKQQLCLDQSVFQRCNLPLILSRTFETDFRKVSVLSKIWKIGVEGSCYLRYYDGLRTRIDM